MRNFWYPGPIDPDSPLFFGRQQELGTLQELCQGELQSYLIIFGGRQTGKTSLLYQVPALLDQSSHLVCHIDFQGLPNANPSQVYQHIASELTLVADWDEPKSPLQTPAMLTRWLLQKVNQMSQAKLVLLFEELGVLPPNTAKALANLLRSWFNGRFNPGRQAFSQVMIALAGGVELYDLAAVKVSPLRNICKPLYLPDLSQTDAVNLVATGLEQARFSNEQGVQCGQAVYQLLAGHPYLTQRLGSEIAKLTPGNWSQITNLPYLADQILLNDALLQHFYHALDNLDLWAALPVLLEGSTKHSRHDRDMALLELLGLAINRDGYWGVRNNFFKATLQQWQNKSHTTSLTPSLTNIQPNSTSIVHQQSIPETRQRALWRVLNAVKSVSAKTVLYAAALGTIGIMYGANLPPELVALAGAIGGDALTNILERIASGDKISDEEITQEVQTIIIESDIADRLSEETFQREIARLMRQQNLLRAAIEQQEYVIVDLLAGQFKEYQAITIELQDDIWLIQNQLQNLATSEQSQEIVLLLEHVVELLEREPTHQPPVTTAPSFADKVQESNLQDLSSKRYNSLRRQLAESKDTLNKLEEQLAVFTVGNQPIHLLKQKEAIETRIGEIEADLEQFVKNRNS